MCAGYSPIRGSCRRRRCPVVSCFSQNACLVTRYTVDGRGTALVVGGGVAALWWGRGGSGKERSGIAGLFSGIRCYLCQEMLIRL